MCVLGLEAAVDSGVRPRTGSWCGFMCSFLDLKLVWMEVFFFRLEAGVD